MLTLYILCYRFSINSNTAEITVACINCLDKELQHRYNLNLVATDGGGLLDTAQITITVEDINDNAPHFTLEMYESLLEEGSTTFSTPVIVQVIHY